jgi:mRNA interferase MazF
VKRGGIVSIATGRGFGGKPRPALIIQADVFEKLGNVVTLPITSVLADHESAIRIRIAPDTVNGLRMMSEVMTDLPVAVPKERIGKSIGSLAPSDLTRVEHALLMLLGFAD